MKKQILIIIASNLLCSLTMFAQQTDIEKNSIYAELLGNGGVYSINYDRTFQIDKGIKLVPRIGFATIQDIIIVPFEVNVLLSRDYMSKNFFETGIGLTLLKPTNQFSGEIITINGYNYNFENKTVNTPLVIRAGFRHQRPTGGLMYRTGLLLFTGTETLFTIGIGLGYTF